MRVVDSSNYKSNELKHISIYPFVLCYQQNNMLILNKKSIYVMYTINIRDETCFSKQRYIYIQETTLLS